MADTSPLRQVVEATVAGGLLGSMFGSINSYLKSPVVVGYNRAPAWRDVSTELYSSTKWWAGAFFTYVFVKNFSASARGLAQPDEWASFTGGASTGAFYALRGGIHQKSIVTLALVGGIGCYIFEGPWKNFSPLHKRVEIQKANDLELNLRYKQKIAEDKAVIEQQLIALEKKAINQVQ